MNVKRLVLLLVVLAALGAAGTAGVAGSADSAVAVSAVGADRARDLAWQNKVLEAELHLAKGDAVYFILDAGQGKILFKARGIELREWSFAGFGGRPLNEPIQSTSVLKKRATVVPKRKLIDPKNPQTAQDIGSYEPDALESKDMPSEFLIELENGVRIHVISGKESLGSWLSHWQLSVDGAIFELARDFWSAAFKPEDRTYRIHIDDPAEARTLCWSLGNGMRGLVLQKTY